MISGFAGFTALLFFALDGLLVLAGCVQRLGFLVDFLRGVISGGVEILRVIFGFEFERFIMRYNRVIKAQTFDYRRQKMVGAMSDTCHRPLSNGRHYFPGLVKAAKKETDICTQRARHRARGGCGGTDVGRAQCRQGSST